ncbi:hypothetical protein ACJJTC_000688 [Scirpophaga incertulas]
MSNSSEQVQWWVHPKRALEIAACVTSREIEFSEDEGAGVQWDARNRPWGASAGGPRECCSRNSPRISVIRPAPPLFAAARAHFSPHYPLTIRNRPTSWLLDLGYNDLTSAK